MKRISYFIIVLLFLYSCGNNSTDINLGEVIYEHNKFRVLNNRDQLKIDESLMSNAQKWANNMARKNSMYHSNLSGINFPYKAENIAMGTRNEIAVTQQWENSHGHKVNMLGKQYQYIGVGYAKSSNGTPYWCVQFGGEFKRD